MKKSFDLANASLFANITPQEQASLLDCLGARRKSAARQTFLLMAGQPVEQMGLVLSGSVQVLREDYWGNRTIVERFGPGELFGETLAFAAVQRSPVSVEAAEDAEVLLLDCGRLLHTCPASCVFHARLIENLVGIFAQRNVAIMQKMQHLTRRTTREKLLSYLSAQAQQAGSDSFSLPFDRQELADYLAVNRSALSSELGRMRDEGLIRFERNRFTLLADHEGM